MKNIKKILTVVLSCALAVCMLTLVACGGKKPDPVVPDEPDGPKPQPEITVTLDKTEASVEEGKTLTLVATVKNSTDSATFDSSNKAAATVTATGNTATVTAVAEGTTNITAKVGSKTATCKVTVTAKPVPALEVNAERLVLEIGGEANNTAELSAQLKNATGDITYTSADTEIVSVAVADGKATVTAVALGKTTITVAAGELSEEVPVEVATYGLTYALDTTAEEGQESLIVSDSETKVSGEVRIPGYYYSEDFERYLPVTKITGQDKNSSAQLSGTGGFQGNENITSVYLGDNLRVVGHGAFRDCTALVTVNTTSALTEIGDWAFGNTAALKDIIWTEECNVSIFGMNAFNATGIEEMSVPKSVTNLNYGVFQWTKLKRIKIYAPITKMENSMFFRADELVEIWLPATLTEIDHSCFGGYSGSPTDGPGMPGSFTVNFAGTEEQWNAIKINSSNNGVISNNKDELPTIFNYNVEY